MTAHVVVIGDAAVDIVARPSAALVFGDDVRSTITMTPGGAAANTAAWLAFCGASVTLVSRIGDDPAGELLRRSLTDAGVRCAFTVDPAAATGCVVALVDPDGQRTMMSDRGANARLEPADVDAEVLAGAAHLHLSGYVLLDESSRAAGIAALELARAAGLTTSVDPQSAAMIDDPAEFVELLRGVNLLLPNAAELAALTGSGLSETVVSGTGLSGSEVSESGLPETVVSRSDQSESGVSAFGLPGAAAPTSGPSGSEVSEAGQSGSEVSRSGLSGSGVSGFGSSGFGISGSAVRGLLEVVGAVAVTTGAGGAIWLGPDGEVSMPAEAVDCVNSTGAGDAFNAGFLTAWLTRADPRAALEAGGRAGALAVRQVGAWPVSRR
jgi:sugar/nucleoside kinase (ribokinase family)